MLKKSIKIFMVSSLLLVCGCTVENIDKSSFEAVTELADLNDIADMKKVIVKEEKPYKSSNDIRKVDQLPEFPIESLSGWFLGHLDLSKIDLSNDIKLKYASFDDKTIWPDQLPEYFDPEEILENGKNPGLGIRTLHEQGITGKGVNIAIIDQTLDSNHLEYENQLLLYEKLHVYQSGISMHGPAVSSIAVGKTVGVAPEANLYFIACDFYDIDEKGENTLNFNYLAQAIERIIEINNVLPVDNKISVISISRGYSLGENEEIGAKELYYAIEEAKKNGIFVITTTPEYNYNFDIYGLGRELNGDPDDLKSYKKGLFWQDYENIINWINNKNTILVPMDGRTYAGMAGNNNYEYSADGGLSWSVPWLAGMYALCVQIEPNLDPDTFIDKAIETGDSLKLDHGDEIKTVINPQRLIEAIKNQ